MAAVIPEAAEAVGEGTSAVRGASSASAAGAAGAGRHRGRPSAGERREQGLDARRTRRDAQVSANRDQRAARDRARQRGDRARQRGRRAAGEIGRLRVPGNRNYQPVILAEFLLAVLVVALAPIAKGGTDTAKAKGGPSPYDTNSLKQILMIGVVYFVLALLSSGQRAGRISAWFGGLVLVAVGVQQTVNGGLLAVFKMFGFGTGAGLGTFPAGGDASGVLPPLDINAGQFSPGALGQGVTQTLPTPTGYASPISAYTNPDLLTAPADQLNPTGAFPTLEPGGQIVAPPAGGTGTATT